MGTGETLFNHLRTQRGAGRQYNLGFLPEPDIGQPFKLALDTESATIQVEVEDFGDYGVMLESIRLCLSGGNGGVSDVDNTANIVERIVDDVENPYGPVRCVEIDRPAATALLRTDPNGDGRFFEILVEGGAGIELKHYVVTGENRERVRTPVNLGRDVFVLLVDGLVEALVDNRAGLAAAGGVFTPERSLF